MVAGLVAIAMAVPFLWLLLLSFSRRTTFGLQVPLWTGSNYSTVLSATSGLGSIRS
ncbi:MAG: hypothetical protein ABSD85_17055 [Acidimicrobiales bacterium]